MEDFDYRKIFIILSSLVLVLLFKNFSEATTINRLLFLYGELCIICLGLSFPGSPKFYKKRR